MDRRPADRRREGWYYDLRRGAYGLMLWYSQQALADDEATRPFALVNPKVSVSIETLRPSDAGSSGLQEALYRVEISRDDPRLTPRLSRLTERLRRQTWHFGDGWSELRQLRGGVRLDIPLYDSGKLHLNFIPGQDDQGKGMRWNLGADGRHGRSTSLWSFGGTVHSSGPVAYSEKDRHDSRPQLGLMPQLSLSLDPRQAAAGSRLLTLQHGDWVDRPSGEVCAKDVWQLALKWRF